MILVTGASGFVGEALLRELAVRGVAARATSRQRPRHLPAGCDWLASGDLGPQLDWRRHLSGVDCVIHCAARVHVMDETADDILGAYRRANVDGTLDLARQSAEAGVRRFVLISSIKANGEMTVPGRPFKAADEAHPIDPYGISKLEAERGLAVVAEASAMSWTVVRPPLVYGPGVKANFLAMMRWLVRGVPLPLGAVLDNRRSLLAIDNLIDLLIACIDHPQAAGRVFLAADGEDLSTTELLRRMGQALQVRPRLLPVPTGLLHLGGALLGRRDVVQRLLGNLQVDIGDTRRILGWTPPLSVDEGLRRAAAAFLS